MEHSEFYLSADGMRIHVKLDKPEGEKLPLLLLSHGITGHMEEDHILGLARHLSERGYAVLRMELYGHGKSDGAFFHHSIYKWVNQICQVIDYARGLPWVSNLYLAGHSQGGLSVILAGAQRQAYLKAILPLSPAINIWQGAREGNLLGNVFDPVNLPERICLNGEEEKALDTTYLSNAQFLPVEESIQAFQKPVFLIHGDADEAVPLPCSTWAAEKYANAGRAFGIF